LAQVEQLLPAAGASSVERIAVQREFKSLH
jgi:hypothetical protein